MTTAVRLLRRFLRSTPGRTVIVVLVLYSGYQVWIAVQASGKVDPTVYERTDEDGEVAVEVHLNFPPQRFHILEIQKFGRIRRVEGNTVELHSVLPAGVRSLARRYWISSIEPLSLRGQP
ncbi:MAG TPA: hypothetical protein VHL78_05445 [Actinomycetota bacterium]|nr:hypothetical protein [Actinomycetota bacterium]